MSQYRQSNFSFDRKGVMTAMDSDDRIAYSIMEAARLMGMSDGALRQLVWKNKLPVSRVGHRVFVLREDLQRLLQRTPA